MIVYFKHTEWQGRNSSFPIWSLGREYENVSRGDKESDIWPNPQTPSLVSVTGGCDWLGEAFMDTVTGGHPLRVDPDWEMTTSHRNEIVERHGH